ncbi:hypothetical protein B0T17DRAFT_307895 [Bombardia bombarda]|uniref:Uncharacterized protein n=1 Tax=Bombardia bombarda TaxID=252184 RepID=A0AA40C2I0_9PEZI|nr:hypothetical protein B0T17DRAFT_307895 [Bombardia bombarda]
MCRNKTSATHLALVYYSPSQSASSLLTLLTAVASQTRALPTTHPPLKSIVTMAPVTVSCAPSPLRLRQQNPISERYDDMIRRGSGFSDQEENRLAIVLRHPQEPQARPAVSPTTSSPQNLSDLAPQPGTRYPVRDNQEEEEDVYTQSSLHKRNKAKNEGKKNNIRQRGLGNEGENNGEENIIDQEVVKGRDLGDFMPLIAVAVVALVWLVLSSAIMDRQRAG